MAVLREISEKLGELLASVLGEAEKGTKMKKAVNEEIQKSLEEVKEELNELSESSSSSREDVDDRLKSLESKLEDIEQSGGASFDLGDEDEEEIDSDSETQKGESLFSDVVGLSDITKSIEKKRRNLK